MDKFWHKYVLILTTTKEILLNPFEFGEGIEDRPKETKRAAIYLGEGVIFFYTLFQLATFGSDIEIPYAGNPFSAEVLAAMMIATALLSGLITHPVALWFSGGNTSIHGSLASFLYWSRFCLFVIPPIFAALIMGSDWIFEVLYFGDDMKLFSFMAVGVPFIFVYYMGTISSWIGSAYRMESIMGGISVAIAYTTLTAAGSVVLAIASGASKMFA